VKTPGLRVTNSEQTELIEQLRHACSVACGDLLALGMPAGTSTGKLLLAAIAAAEQHLSQESTAQKETP
jgi:hypothetical protein